MKYYIRFTAIEHCKFADNAVQLCVTMHLEILNRHANTVEIVLTPSICTKQITKRLCRQCTYNDEYINFN